MDFPKTLVIKIFTHGEQSLDNTGLPTITNVPANMTIQKIDGVLPGVANVSTVENFENIGQTISNLINKRRINWDEMTSEQAYELTKLIAKSVINANYDMSSQIDKDYDDSISKNDPIPFLSQYVHTSAHPMRILTYRENEEMPDKLFTKINPGELINPDGIPENYTGKIIMLNVEGEPDIFDIIDGFDDTPFSGLNAFFEAMGVENLIVIDLSCNVFTNVPPGSRKARATRRRILQDEKSIKIPKISIDDRSHRLESRKFLSKLPKKKGGNKTRKNRKLKASKIRNPVKKNKKLLVNRCK
jgi:hypothetical protein